MERAKSGTRKWNEQIWLSINNKEIKFRDEQEEVIEGRENLFPYTSLYTKMTLQERRAHLLQMTKCFYEDLQQRILEICSSQFSMLHCDSNKIPSQTVTVYMLKSSAQHPGDISKPTPTHSGQVFNSSMRREIDRYGTFESWPNSTPAWPNRLAAAGFYYTGQTDMVTCYSCGVSNSGWRTGMDPRDVHKRLSPTCNFIRNQAGNEPVLENGHAKAHLRFICGDRNMEAHNSSGYFSLPQEPNRETSESQQMTLNSLATSVPPVDMSTFPPLPVLQENRVSDRSSNELFMSGEIVAQGTLSPNQAAALHMVPEEVEKPTEQNAISISNITGTLGIHTNKPLHPEFALTAERLKSFNAGWPSSNTQKPTDLAEAGFFYNGNGDSVRCFYCGTGLRNWDTGGNPWVEHARWSPQCVYLSQHQGQDFITIVQTFTSEGNQVDYNQVLEIIKDMQPTPTLVNQIGQADSNQGGEEVWNPDSHDDSLLEAEYDELKQQTMCKICLDREVSIVFLPCGHLVCCPECAPALRTCPMCRASIKGTVRAYMS